MHRFPSIYIVFVLWVAGLCAAAQFAKMALVLPELGHMYPDAGASLGILISSISFVGALLGLSASVLAIHIGTRRLLLAGLALGSVISLIQSAGLPLPMLLATRVIEGFAHLAIVVSAPTLIASYCTPRFRASAMTLWGTFFGVSFALTAWLGLPLVATQGVKALFFCHGVLMSITTIVVFLALPAQPAEAIKADRNSLTLPALAKRHVQTWTSPYLAAPAVGWLFYTITFVALLALLPGKVQPDNREFTAAILPIISILSSITIGVLLLQWCTAVRSIQIGFITAIVFAISIPFSPAVPWTIPWTSIALFSALGIVQGASFAAVPQLNQSSSDQALANGAIAQAGNFGNSIGTPLLLMVLAIGGLNTVIIVVVMCYAGAICGHMILAKRRQTI